MDSAKRFFGIYALIAMMAFASPALAQMGQGGMGHEMMGGMGKMSQCEKKKSGAGHACRTRWKDTLTNEQRAKIDKMHLALKKTMSVLKARLELKEVELKNLALDDSPDMNAINKKIDEMMAVKTEMKKHKYAHMVEMRAALTPEQRASFDMGVLGKDSHEKGHGCCMKGMEK